MDSTDAKAFIHTKQSLMLSTNSQNGFPHASYSPFVLDGDCFCVRLSLMAKHAQNLIDRPQASIMIIDDESETDNIFARRRIMLECEAIHLKRDTDEWNLLQQRFAERFGGDTNNQLVSFLDFQSFLLTPLQGRLVLGFGQAYSVDSHLSISSQAEGMGHQKRG